MGTTTDLSGSEAVAKMREIAKDSTAMFCTLGQSPGMIARPMATQGIDDDGTLWFFSQRGSRKNQEIEANPTVQLHYAHTVSSKFLTVIGTARVLRDQEKIDALWSQWAKTWFSEGKQDPELTLIEFKPTAAHYWDTQHNAMVQLAGIALGAVIGKPLDDGREGELRTSR